METYKWNKMRRRIKDNELFYREIEKYVDCCIYSIIETAELYKAVDNFPWPQDVFLDSDALKKRVKNPYHIERLDIHSPGPMNKPMHNLYIYQKYDFFMKQFEFLCGPENLETFEEYVRALEPAAL